MKWTEKEVSLLIMLVDQGKTFKEIQDEHFPHRSYSSVADKLFRLQKRRNRKHHDILVLYQKGLSISEIAKKIGRSESVVSYCIHEKNNLSLRRGKYKN